MKRLINNNKTKTFDLYNKLHLGDSIFNIHYMNQYYNQDYKFNYYVNPVYFDELKNHIKNPNINLLPIDQSNSSFYNMWIGHNRFFWEWTSKSNLYDIMFVDYFNLVSNHLGIECRINNKYDMLFDNSNFKVSVDGNFDYLIINSVPLSGQFTYVENDFINLCDFFTEKNISFITTKKVKNYKCTLDYNMSIVDIGNLSNQCKNIIGVNTSPIITTFTKQNIETVNNRFILDNVLTFSYNERIHQLKNLNEIYNFI
jgi:hypothetical protein